MLTLTPHPPLRPRTVPYEPTLEQQQQAYARAERRALHWQLHTLFLTETPESAFDGKMNLPPERSESEIGCEFTSAFVGWLMTHTIPEHAEMQRRRVLFAILQRLAREQPDLSLIVLEHSRIVDISQRIENSLIGRNVEITRSPLLPKAYKMTLGDHSKVGLL